MRLLSFQRISLALRQKRHLIEHPLYRNSLFLMANTFIMSGLGFVFWMIAARFYSEVEVGLGSAIVSAIMFIALLSKLGLDAALIRRLPTAEKPADLINSCFTLSGAVALVLAAIFIAGLGLWSPALSFVRQNAVFSIAFVLFVLLWVLSEMMNFLFAARRRTDFTLLKNTIYSLLKIPLLIFMATYFHAFGIVASWGIAMGIALAASMFLLLPRVLDNYKPLPKLTPGIVKETWRYTAGNYLANLLSVSPALLLPIMIVNLLGAEQNAHFYVAWMVAGLLFAIPISVSQSLFVEGSHFEAMLGVNVRRSFRFTFLLLIPAIVVLFVFGKWPLLAFGAGYSTNALQLLRILSISSLFTGINSIYYGALRVEGRIRELVVIVGFITIVVLSASYFILPATGIIGVGYVWISAQGMVSIYVLLAIRPYYVAERA